MFQGFEFFSSYCFCVTAFFHFLCLYFFYKVLIWGWAGGWASLNFNFILSCFFKRFLIMPFKKFVSKCFLHLCFKKGLKNFLVIFCYPRICLTTAATATNAAEEAIVDPEFLFSLFPSFPSSPVSKSTNL